MPSEEAKFEGLEVKLGGEIYVIPALSLAQAKKFEPVMKLVDSIGGDEIGKKVDEAMPLMVAAFQRNYPDMTAERIADLVDLRTFRQVLMAIAGANGFHPVAVGELRPAALTGTGSSQS